MTTSERIGHLLTVALVTMGSAWMTAGRANAQAAITYVGNQIGIEAYVNTPTEGWRNTTPAKPLDIDGDNILGTDGWWISSSKSNPSYATVTQGDGAKSSTYSAGVWDDPADPSGPDKGVIGYYDWSSPQSRPFVEITIVGSDLDGKTLRLGVLYDTMPWARTGITYTLTQTAGGDASASSPSINTGTTHVAVLFFDITGAAAGDKFVVTAHAGNRYHEFGGVTLDSVGAPIPPGTVILLR